MSAFRILGVGLIAFMLWFLGGPSLGLLVAHATIFVPVLVIVAVAFLAASKLKDILSR
jgi:hypothetical protein